MIFSLEVLQAKHGDSLILHYGKKDDPKIIVIDGGPSGVYTNFLKPRLLAIKEQLSPDKALPLSMVMVSHMDDDHVNGILALTNDVLQRKTDQESAEFDLGNLWFNAFDDIVGNLEIPNLASVSSTASAADISTSLGLPDDFFEHPVAAVIASTGQGRELKTNAVSLSAAVNNPFKPLDGKANLVRGDIGQKTISWSGLKIQVIHPNEERLQKLQAQWDKDLKKAKEKGDNKVIFASLGNTDSSPFNLSSIVCVIELGGKKILFTGDGRSDDIYEGLKQNNLLDEDGNIHFDILKMPHHGSERDLSADFLQKVTADNYVISADGNFDNPDTSTIKELAKVTKPSTLFLTNHTGKRNLQEKLDKILAEIKTSGTKLKVVFRDEAKDSLLVDLLEPVDY